MVFRLDAIQARLRRLEEVVSELRELGKLDRDELERSQRDMWAVERGLHLGAELLFDIGNHILSTKFGVSPADYRDIVEQLAHKKILDADLHQRLQGLAGFRNILVHDYIHLDSSRVQEALARAPKDFSDFALTIRNWLEGKTEA